MLRYVQSHKKIVNNDKQLIIFITDIFKITPHIWSNSVNSTNPKRIQFFKVNNFFAKENYR